MDIRVIGAPLPEVKETASGLGGSSQLTGTAADISVRVGEVAADNPLVITRVNLLVNTKT